MSLFGTFNTAGSGMSAERFRMDVIAHNIANVNTVGYRRQLVEYAPRGNDGWQFDLPFNRQFGTSQSGTGVRVVGTKEDPSPFRMEYDPGNPRADARGYVAKPNVNVMTEMVDMITASRAYEANVTVMRESKNMLLKALTIGR